MKRLGIGLLVGIGVFWLLLETKVLFEGSSPGRYFEAGFDITHSAIASMGWTSTVTDYPVHCEGKVNVWLNKCEGKITFTLNRSTYRVDIARQEVIEQCDYPGAMPTRLKGCTVMDTLNWSCCIVDEDGKFCQEMSHGRFNVTHLIFEPNSNMKLGETDTVYVSSLYWWYLEIHLAGGVAH